VSLTFPTLQKVGRALRFLESATFSLFGLFSLLARCLRKQFLRKLRRAETYGELRVSLPEMRPEFRAHVFVRTVPEKD
jgi:hypothetical protein